MNVSDLLQNKFGAHPDHVIACSVDDLVQDALEKMYDQKVGALVVMNGSAVSGVFSERDVVRLAQTNSDGFRDLKLTEVMTKEVISISPDQPVENALELMKDNGIRHLTVMQGENLVGFLSLRDLMMYKIEYSKQVADFMKGQLLNHSEPLPM